MAAETETKAARGEGAPRRIAIVGCSGAGKTTLGREIERRTGIPHVEIDSLYHGPGWTPAPRDVLRKRVEEIVAGDCWVIDGNYRSAIGDVVRRTADTVLWLDLPRRTVMASVIRRTWTRAWRREELWNGNRESFRFLWDPRPTRNIVLWSWTQFSTYRARYEEERREALPGTTWLRFRSREDVAAWLAALPAGSDG